MYIYIYIFFLNTVGFGLGVFLFCFVYGLWKFPDQGLNLSHGCHVGSFDPLCRARDRTLTSLETQTTAVEFLTHCATAGTPIPLLVFEYSFCSWPPLCLLFPVAYNSLLRFFLCRQQCHLQI